MDMILHISNAIRRMVVNIINVPPLNKIERMMYMSFRNALVTQLLNDKKYTALQEYLQIEFPGKDTVMIQEYAGEVPRVFYNMDDNIMLMLPGSMNTYMENAVANAIQSGTIFDDAENVKNTAEYIRMTTLPYGGMALKGHDEPKALKSTIGSVVGAMNVDTAHFGDGENDLQNGYTAMKDMMSHANDSDMATTKLIKDYIKLKDDGKLPTEYRRTLGKVKYDVKNLEDVTCDDCITKSDYRPMKLTDECGSVCAVDEFDDTNASTEEIADDAKSLVKDQTDIIDEEDDVVNSSEFEGGGKEDVSFDESFIDFTECDALFKEMADVYTLMELYERRNSFIMESDKASFGDKVIETRDKIIAWFKSMLDKLRIQFTKMKLKQRILYLEKGLKAGKQFQCLPVAEPEVVLKLRDDLRDLRKQRSIDMNNGGPAENMSMFMNPEYVAEDIAHLTELINIETKLVEIFKQTVQTQRNTEWKNMNREDVIKDVDIARTHFADIENLLYRKRFGNFEKRRIDDKVSIQYVKHWMQLSIRYLYLLMLELFYITKTLRYTKDDEPLPKFNDSDFVEDVEESFYNTSNNHDEIYSESVFNKRPKKLKPIPRDIVAYITIEMNNIHDSNDQAMLAGYTCSKLELVDFYLNCIDTEDDRYIVPHTRQYLVQMQNDLNRLLTQILRIKPVNKMDRIWKIGVNLPG